MTDKLPHQDEEQEFDQTKSDQQFRKKRKMLARVPVKQVRSAMLINTTSEAKLYREVYDAGEMPLAIGKLIWKEGQRMIKGDKDAINVIKGAGLVWKFYMKQFNRNSIDNQGLPIIQTIRYREHAFRDYYNAFWDIEQMFYGTGNKKYTQSFTSDLDIIGHELTHGVMSFEARLEYEFQSGALDESIADIFGIMVKQWANKTEARRSDWLIGKNILKGTNALRSLKAPGTAYKNDPIFDDDPQPAVMSDYIKSPNTEKGDWGGVHINSGIPNFAFYVTCYELGGFSWEKAGQVWYETMTRPRLLTKKSNFEQAAAATLKVATSLFGKNSVEVQAFETGWRTAGVI